MKKIITVLSFITLFIPAALMAQSQNPTAHSAETSYDQASLNNALKTKIFEFTLKDLTESDVKMMEKNAVPYEKFFSVNISAADNSHICKIVFKDDVQMKIVSRFFIANNISEVIYKGEKVTAQSFFSQWM